MLQIHGSIGLELTTVGDSAKGRERKKAKVAK